jgi:hypothetical protein
MALQRHRLPGGGSKVGLERTDGYQQAEISHSFLTDWRDYAGLRAPVPDTRQDPDVRIRILAHWLDALH